MKVKQVYRDPCAMLEALAKQQTKRNIYFLDVELKHPEYDGFLLGREIRKIDPNGTIVYITSFKDLAYKTFQYHIEAFDYIVKDTQEQLHTSISECLQSIIQRLKDETKILLRALRVKVEINCAIFPLMIFITLKHQRVLTM